MLCMIAGRGTRCRRTLALFIGMVVIAIFVQYEQIVRTSFPPPRETFLVSDWIKPTTENKDQLSARGSIRQLSQQHRHHKAARATENTRTTSAASAAAIPSIINLPENNEDPLWAPPRLHTCHLQPNRTVTFAIPRRHVIIAGAQKSGTSALYFFLRQHPHLLAAKSIESHFFDWQYPYSQKEIQRWMQERHLLLVTTDYFNCALRYEYFTQYFDGELLWERHLQNKSLITFEKTPAYLFLDKVPRRIYDVLSADNLIATQIVVSLRHPVERAYSQFHSDRIFEQVPWNDTIEYYLNKELGVMRRFGLTKAPNAPLGGGGVVNDTSQLDMSQSFEIPKRVLQSSSKWLDQAHWNVYRNTFQNNYLQRSMYSVQLRRWIKYFTLNQSLLVLPYEAFLDQPLEAVEDILHFCQVPMPDYFATKKGNASAEFKSVYYHHGGKKDPLSPLTRQYMERFLEPYHRDLAQLLRETKHNWTTIWKHLPPSKETAPVENHMLFPANPKHDFYDKRIQKTFTQTTKSK